MIRQSNFELLRIVSMFFILTLHIIGIGLGFYDKEGDISNIKLLIESFSIIGVNCFILITGYFGINFKIKSLVSFVSQCFFYSLAIPLVFLSFDHNSLNLRNLISSFFPFGHNTWWFIGPYLCLYLVSPALNIFINSTSKKQFLIAIIILSFINIYLGWFWRGAVNPAGYSVFHFIFLYFLGRYIKFHTLDYRRRTYVKIYIASSILIYLTSYIVLKYAGIVWMQKIAFAYNNPIVLISSISLFLMFHSLKFESKWINYLSGPFIFSVYLIHMHPLIHPIFFSNIKKCYFFINNQSTFYFTIFFLEILFIVLSVLIDRVRHSFFEEIENKVALYITSKVVKYLEQ